MDSHERLGEWHHIWVRVKDGEKIDCFKANIILDVGCGSGSYAIYLMNRYSSSTRLYVSLDINKGSLQVAKRLKGNLDKLELILADAHKLPFKDKAFDLIFSTDVLEHLSNPSYALKEMKRVGNEKFYICTPNKLCPIDMSKIAKYFGSHKPPPIERYVTRWQLKKFLRQANFDNNVTVIERSFLPLGWLLKTKKMKFPIWFIHILIRIEIQLEKIPLINRIAGVLVAYRH